MKRLLLSLLAILAAATAPRAEVDLVVVHQKSGGTVEFAFLEKPVVTYSGDNLVVTVQEGSVSFPLSDVQKFTFGKFDGEPSEWTRISAPANVAPQPTFIYNVGGVLMRTLQPGDDGSTPASLDGLPAGIYIIKNGKTTYKTIKR